MAQRNDQNSLPVAATEKTDRLRRPCTCIPLRYLMLILCFTGFTFVYILRVNIGVAIVAMMNSTEHNRSAFLSSKLRNQCLPENSNMNNKPNDILASHLPVAAKHGEFNWTEQTKAQILATFYYGYLFTSLSGGYLSHRFGSYKVFGISVLLTSLPTLLSAPAARLSPWALLAVRLIEGLADGVAFPAIHTFWSHWAPVKERTRLIGITYSGTYFGAIVGNFLAGWLTQTYGWPTVFYVSGIAATLWCLPWFVFAASSPRESRWISKYELEFIESNSDRAGGPDASPLPSVPWRKFATSSPVYAILVSQFASAWILGSFATYTPSYLANVLKFSTAKTGMVNASPYTAQLCTGIVLNFTADFLLRCGRPPVNSRRKTVVRRVMNGIGMFGPGVFIALVPSAGCNATVAVAMLVLSLATLGGCSAGFLVNHVDVAAEYAGHLMAIGSALSTISGLLVPTVAAVLVGPSSTQTVASWSKFLYLLSGIQISGGIFYSIWGSGERLSWLDGYLQEARQAPT